MRQKPAAVSKIPGAITFAVDDVELATELLLEHSVFDEATDLIGEKLESVSDATSLVLHTPSFHPLVAATFFAYCDHRPLVLSPDVIWCVIVQGLAHHIAQDPESFRKHFVTHEGKKAIKIRRDDFELGSPNNPWQEAIGEFSAQIKDQIGESMHQLIVADFSTTTPTARVASEVALMDCTQHYFHYVLMTLCGIPQITLTGNEGDWNKLKDKLCFLNERFALGWWLDRVSPIADQFISAAKGSPDRNFWSNIFKYNGMSGGPFIDGWLMDLFPYFKDPMSNEVKTINPRFSSDGTQSYITTSMLPVSVCRAPFVWEYDGQALSYEFIGGFTGVEQNHEIMALTPKIGWAVRPQVREGLKRYNRVDRAHIFRQTAYIDLPDVQKLFQINEPELQQVITEFAEPLGDLEKIHTYNQNVFRWFCRADEDQSNDDSMGCVRVIGLDGRSKAEGLVGDATAWDQLENLLVSMGGTYENVVAFREMMQDVTDAEFLESLFCTCSHLMPKYSDVTEVTRLAMRVVGGDALAAQYDAWIGGCDASQIIQRHF